MAEDGVDLEDPEQNVAARYIEEETQREKIEKLHKAISVLTGKQQIVVKKIYFEGKRKKMLQKN